MKMCAILLAVVATGSLAINGQSVLAAGRGDGAGRGTAAGRGDAARGAAALGRGDAARGPAAGRGDAARLAAAGRGDAPARGVVVDKREANQARRIDQGITKGQLTSNEVSKLQEMETNITTTEATFKSDGKLSKDEAGQLRKALNDASLQIWAERHDDAGNQKPAMRLGKDVFAQDELTGKIESGEITKAQAKQFLEDFRRMANMKRRLGSDNLTAAQRTSLQAEYNTLLNKYFVIR